MKVEPEVSEIDPNNTLVVNDTTIPGLVTRRAKTTVELRDGQSFAIAGLLQANHSKARRQLPWLGQVPVIGSLFRSASFEKQETDLVIIVTPRLVQPAAPGDRLVTPFDKSVPGNDVDYFLNGKGEIPTWKSRFRRSGKVNRRAPSSGHMLGSTGPAFPNVSLDRGKYTGSIPKGDPRDITGSLPSEQKATTPKNSKRVKPAAAKTSKKKTSAKTSPSEDSESKGLLGGFFRKKEGVFGGTFRKAANVAFAKPSSRTNLSLDLDGGA